MGIICAIIRSRKSEHLRALSLVGACSLPFWPLLAINAASQNDVHVCAHTTLSTLDAVRSQAAVWYLPASSLRPAAVLAPDVLPPSGRDLLLCQHNSESHRHRSPLLSSASTLPQHGTPNIGTSRTKITSYHRSSCARSLMDSVPAVYWATSRTSLATLLTLIGPTLGMHLMIPVLDIQWIISRKHYHSLL